MALKIASKSKIFITILAFWSAVIFLLKMNVFLPSSIQETFASYWLKWPKSQSEHPVTIVTALFHFHVNIKHKFKDYEKWIPNFTRKIEKTPIIVYCSPEMKQFLEFVTALKTEGKTKNILFIVYDNVWAIPWLKRPVPLQPSRENSSLNSSIISSWKDAYTIDQYPKDKSIWGWNSPELYAIWNSKTWMLADAAKLNPFGSKYFFWVDIGSFRDPNHKFKFWPFPLQIEKIFNPSECKNCLRTNRIILGIINPLKREIVENFNESLPPLVDEFVQAGFFGE